MFPNPDDWADWLLLRGFVPVGFLTLTFDSRRGAMSDEGALWWWRQLVRQLNEDAGGRKYRRKWGHSWFSYVVGLEYHKSGVPHLHALVDGRVSFARVHALWQLWNWFSLTKIVLA